MGEEGKLLVDECTYVAPNECTVVEWSAWYALAVGNLTLGAVWEKALMDLAEYMVFGIKRSRQSNMAGFEVLWL